MPARRILPDSGKIRQLHRTKTYAEIAEMYGVTETAVYLRVREDSPRDITPKPRYSDYIPWRVRVEHAWAPPAKYLRLLARVEAGGEVPEARRRALERWIERLRVNNWVVAYDPEAPPSEASPTHGGFFFVPREASDMGWVRKPASNDASNLYY